MFGAVVKSAPTSGPFTVSSQVIQLPHGMRPPAQFIWVPLRLVKAWTTSPLRGDLDGGRATARVGVVGRAGAERAGDGAVDLVVADQPHVALLPAEGGHAVVAAGQHGAVVEDHGRAVGVVEGAVPEPVRGGGAAPCRRAGRRRAARPVDGGAASAAPASRAWSEPLTSTPPVVATAPRRKVRRPSPVVVITPLLGEGPPPPSLARRPNVRSWGRTWSRWVGMCRPSPSGGGGTGPSARPGATSSGRTSTSCGTPACSPCRSR